MDSPLDLARWIGQRCTRISLAESNCFDPDQQVWDLSTCAIGMVRSIGFRLRRILFKRRAHIQPLQPSGKPTTCIVQFGTKKKGGLAQISTQYLAFALPARHHPDSLGQERRIGGGHVRGQVQSFEHRHPRARIEVVDRLRVAFRRRLGRTRSSSQRVRGVGTEHLRPPRLPRAVARAELATEAEEHVCHAVGAGGEWAEEVPVCSVLG